MNLSFIQSELWKVDQQPSFHSSWEITDQGRCVRDVGGNIELDNVDADCY